MISSQPPWLHVSLVPHDLLEYSFLLFQELRFFFLRRFDRTHKFICDRRAILRVTLWTHTETRFVPPTAQINSGHPFFGGEGGKRLNVYVCDQHWDGLVHSTTKSVRNKARAGWNSILSPLPCVRGTAHCEGARTKMRCARVTTFDGKQKLNLSWETFFTHFSSAPVDGAAVTWMMTSVGHERVNAWHWQSHIAMQYVKMAENKAFFPPPTFSCVKTNSCCQW